MRAAWLAAALCAPHVVTADARPSAALPALAAPPPIDYYTRHDTTGDVQISPNGEYVALSVQRDGISRIVFNELDENGIVADKPASSVHVWKDTLIYDFAWASATRLLVSIAEQVPDQEAPQPTGELYAFDRDGSRQMIIFGFRVQDARTTGTHVKTGDRTYADGVLLDTLESDDDHVLVAEYPWEARPDGYYRTPEARPTVSLLDIYSGKKRSVIDVPMSSAQVLVDGTARVRAAIGPGTDYSRVAIWRPDPKGDWMPFRPAGFRAGETLVPLHFTPDGKGLLFSGVVEGGSRSALYRMIIAGQGVLPVYSDPVVDIDELVLDLSGRTAIGVGVEPDRAHYHWFEPKHADVRLYQMLERAFPDHVVRITSASRDGRRAVVFVRSDIDPGQYYLFDTQSKHAEFLLASSEWVDPRVLRAREPIELPARDGLVLHGYLTRPSDAPGPFPLVVLPHGGPHGVRDRWGYDWEAELLASRGYAVLQVNYRGSSGYGVDFERAGYGEWGGKMQDDLTDATRWAIAQHFTAADDICIFGASYGGYAALMGVVREPELYQCAVGYAGVYDLELLYRRRSMRGIDMYARYLDRVLGTDAEQQRARSPVNNAGRISVPVLLVHGKADTTAEFEQAKRMRDALEAAHKPYEWLAVGREGHGVYDEENRVEVYTKILDFLGRHLHPIASSAATSAAGS